MAEVYELDRMLPMTSEFQDDMTAPRPAMEWIGSNLRLWAPAKINITLLVGSRRSDGFHPLDSLVAKITLYDRIDLRPRNDGQISFSCDSFDCGSKEKNLAFRAGLLMAQEVRSLGLSPQGADIALSKHVPPGKGLGGGSSDTAAVLSGLNELWSLGLGQERLAELGSSLGSDVPLFFGRRCSRITGRGEHVEPFRMHPFWGILCLCDLATSTPEVYQAFDALAEQADTEALLPGGLQAGILSPPPIGRVQLEEEFLAGRPSNWRSLLRNDLLPAALCVCPKLANVKAKLAQAGVPVCLSGSGSAMFMLFDDVCQARQALGRVEPSLASQCIVIQSNEW